MNEKRTYERYVITNAEDKKVQFQVLVDGKSVHLVDFSLGGLYVLSEKRFSIGDRVNLSIDLGNQSKIDLTGVVVRARPEPDREMWGIAIDLSQTYHLKHILKK